MKHDKLLSCPEIIKTLFYFSFPFIILSVSLGFAEDKWLSFSKGRVTRSSEAASIQSTAVSIGQTQANPRCNIDLAFPGALVTYPDDNGLLAGKYAALSFMTAGDRKLTSYTINGTLTPSKIGKPNLPFVRLQVRIPYAASDDQVRVAVANTNYTALEEKYAIAPVQEQLFESFVVGVDVDNRTFQQDNAVYSKNAYFSHELEYEVGIFHGVKIVDIYFSPVQYNPVTQTVLATRSAQIVVNYASTQPDDNQKTVYRALANIVTFNGIDGSTIPDYSVADIPRGGKFIVVSHDDLINTTTFTDWLNYRKGQGYEHVKTINATSMNASAITSEIKSEYSSSNFDYVIVVGDETKVPIPTEGDDYHYKDYSRLDGTDNLEDVGLGIFLCDDETKFRNILNHQKWHEEGGAWTQTQLSTSGSEVSNGTWNRFSTGHYGTVHLDDPSGTLGYTVLRVYQVASIPTEYGGSNIGLPIVPFEEWTLNPTPFFTSGSSATDEIIKFWNEGVANISHRDHGSNGGPSSPPMSYTLFSTGKITSTCSPFFTSLNCLTGNFKGRHTSNFSYVAQSSQYGPSVNIGATVVTYSGDNDNLHNALYLAMYPKTGTPVLNIGQIWLVGHIEGQTHSRTYFHMYGDPMTNLSIGNMEPFISVNSPNGGEEIEQGTLQEIRWNDNIDGNVKIELLKGGTVASTLAATTESDGTFEWQVPGDLEIGSDYAIRVTSIDSAALTDDSDDDFSIVGEYIIVCPYFQPFDSLESEKSILPNKWEQATTDDFDWLVLSGPTPSKTGSSPDRTGPDGDHTTGNDNYIYMEASDPNSPDKKADFVTPKFVFNSIGDPKLTFWCHMFSADNTMGFLYLDINVDGTWYNEVVTLTDDHGDAWFEQEVDLNQYIGDRVIFRFRGITGSSWCSDICIDDFKIDGSVPIGDIINNALPASFDLKFFGSRIFYQVPNVGKTSHVSIKLYNLQGKLIKTLVDRSLNADFYSQPVSQLATGLYLCRMEAKGFVKTINVLFAK